MTTATPISVMTIAVAETFLDVGDRRIVAGSAASQSICTGCCRDGAEFRGRHLRIAVTVGGRAQKSRSYRSRGLTSAVSAQEA